jgi:hypothetical protein
MSRFFKLKPNLILNINLKFSNLYLFIRLKLNNIIYLNQLRRLINLRFISTSTN